MTPNDDMDDVTRAYQRTQTAEDGPPAALDDAIRAAARRAVQSRPQPVGQGWVARWRTPLSAAAVMVLAVSVVFVAIEEKPDVAPASMQTVTQELREAVPAAPPAASTKKDAATAGVAVQERAPSQTKTIPADVLYQVSPPEVQIAPPALPREKKMAQAGSSALADNNVAPRTEEAARNRVAAVAKEKSIADLSAERRDMAAAPPPAQAAAVGAVVAAAPVVVPVPAAPSVSPAPVIAFAPPPPAAAAGAPVPARAMASSPAPATASAAAPVVSNTSPAIAIDSAKLAEAVTRQARPEPAKPAEAAEARYTAAARQAVKAEAARDALPSPAGVAPQAVAAAKEITEKISVTGSRVAPPVYASPASPVKSLVEQKETADAWIKRIEQLMKDNKQKEAREELARFRKAYPNATLPPALAQLSPE